MKRLLLTILLFPSLCPGQAGLVDVTVDPACVRNIGGVTELNRDQFITIHEAFGSTDMDGADRAYIENVLGARYGRDGGFLSWQAPSIPADPSNPDMPEVKAIARQAKAYRREYDDGRMQPEHMREVVFCTHPELMHAMSNNTHTAWGPRTFDAAAEYTAQLLKLYFSDEERPRYLEVFNEPFVKARKMGTTVEAMSEQHNVVARRVRELNPNVKVGGYSAAWVELEDRNFDHWNGWQKTFMDLAGEEMDFWSYHIYDGVNVKGSPRNRTGSNSEAIMDLVDTYSHLRFGEAKPILITEYGKIPEGNMGNMPYSAERSAGMLYSFNGQLMTYMDHPDRLKKTIPFILGKAEWTYKPDRKGDDANPFLLWRKTAEGTFVETDLSLFYTFWKGVEGAWRSGRSSNPDVRTHLWADGKRLTLALMNLDRTAKTVKLSGLGVPDASRVALRTLTTHGEAPVLEERRLKDVPETLDLAPGESALLLVDLPEPIAPTSVVREHRVYATEYLKDIEADRPLVFTFAGVPTGSGTAVLRLSPGRELGKQVLPSSVKLNGEPLPIPTNWAGGDQAGRKNFFGMIEIPVPMDVVTTASEVEIVYPDTGGKVACVVLQVNREEPGIVVEPETTRAVQGVSEVERKRYFCVSDPGSGFDGRMSGEGVYDYLVDDLGISFGRSLGPVKSVSSTLPEDPDRPGYADLTALKEKKHPKPGDRFLRDFGPNLDVAAHGNHNAYPAYMGKYQLEGAEYHGTPEWIPENIDAAAELAAGVLKYNHTDFDRPAYFEPLNEPHWKYFVDQHFADWHLATMGKVHALTPDVQVGGLCMSVSYFFRSLYHNFTGMRSFMDLTEGKLDFYSFHSYDYLKWEDGDFRGRIQSGLPLEGTLDLVQNYAVNTIGKEVDVVVSELGGYIHMEPKGMYDGELLAAQIAEEHFPGDTWEHELKKRSIVCFVHVSSIIANTMAFIDHPHAVTKTVPFLLPNTWSWDPMYYANLYVPYEYTDRTRWVETHMLDFFKLFRGVDGRRVVAHCSDPDLQVRAFVDGSRLYLAVNNQSWRPESMPLRGIPAASVEIRRFGRNDDFTAYYRETTVATPEMLELAGRETVVLVADAGKPIREKARVDEIVCYGDKVTVPLKEAEFKIRVPVEEEIAYAVLRVGLTRETGRPHDAGITLNGKDLDVPLEDCADRLEKGEYGTTKLVYLDPADLRAENMVTVSFPDGDQGAVGTAVMRVGVTTR